jgi:hypothetical protein
VEKVVRPVLVYGFLVVGLRLAGKRELAQLNAFDPVGSRKRTSDVAHGRLSPSIEVRSSSAQKKKGRERQRAGGTGASGLLPLKGGNKT